MINKLIVNSIYYNIKINYKKLFESYQFKTKNQKYTLKFILNACVYFISISCSYKNFIYNNLNPNTFYKNFMKLNKYKVFESTYKNLLKKYLSKSKNKIKQVYTDTSTFYNKYNQDKVERNKYFKNKKVMKLSLITDQNGIPLNVDLYKGNINDIKIFNDQLTKLDKDYIDKNSTICMADAGYDSVHLRNELNNIFFKCIIPFNKRNTKDENKIKKLTDEEKKLYKSRTKVENTFMNIKKNRRLDVIYEKNSENFLSMIYLSLIKYLI